MSLIGTQFPFYCRAGLGGNFMYVLGACVGLTDPGSVVGDPEGQSVSGVRQADKGNRPSNRLGKD